jgi:hypothetical protein
MAISPDSALQCQRGYAVHLIAIRDATVSSRDELSYLSIGPLIADFCQEPLGPTSSKAVALARSEQVEVVETGRARLAPDCQLGIGSVGLR